MASKIYALLKPLLKHRLCKKLTKMYWYHYSDTVPFWTPIKFQCFIQYIILKLAAFHLPACLPAVRPSCASATAIVFYTTKVIALDLQNSCSNEHVYPLHHGVTFYPLLLSFCLQITYRKMRNLWIGVDKLVRKALINSITSCKVNCLSNQHLLLLMPIVSS